MSNDKRGETEITISGMTYTIRPTFQALRSIEQRTGFGLVTLIRQIAGLTITYGNMVVIIHEALNDIEAHLTEERVGMEVIEQSMQAFVNPLSIYLGSILSKEKITSGNKEKKAAGEVSKH